MSEDISARHLLRQHTGDLHTELDGVLSHTDFDDRQSYAGFLRRQAGPLFAIERQIEGSTFVSDLADWVERRRSDAMHDDLARLDSAPTASSAPIVALASEDHLLGALYVLEGSRLGAKYLVRQARASRDPAVRTATAYLAHGEGQPLWATFLKTLAQREERGIDPDALVEGARIAFGLFLTSAKETQSV